MSVAHKIEEKVRTDDVQISESVDFTGLLLSPSVLEGLTKSGFKRPSPIQLQAIPLGRCGLDLIVQAKSGTGKTCVFTVIALEGLSLQAETLQALILAPTREIAIQIREVVRSIGSCIPELKCHSFIGGTSVQQDKTSLKLCHIATGTPGRIKQLIELGLLKTQSIRLFVLDEADKLLGGDLTECINWIYSSLPDNKQILALSATYPEALAQHLTRYMRNPTFVRLNITDPALIGIKQYHVIVPDCPLPNKVFEAKTEAVIKILSSVSFEQCLIFSNMQTRAQSLQSELQLRNWPTQCIAGCLDQKERSMAMEHLKAYKCRILISTDLTSRGIDADKVNMVINLDVPLDHETYLHRIGRAGRFGSHGAAISIVSKGKQEKELWAVERKCKTHIPKLPDPIPSDLATRYVALKLSDVVITERIITQTESLVKLPTSTLNPLPLDNIEQKHKHTVGNCEKNKDNQFNGDCDTGGDKVIEEKCNSDMRREAEENNFDTNRNSNVDKLAESNGKKKSKDNKCDDTKDSVNMAHNREEQTLKKSDPDLCVRSSLELGTTIEDNEDSTSSWVDICSDNQHIKIKFYESGNGGSVAFSQSQNPDSNQVVIQSTVMEKSKYVGEGIGNTLSTQAGRSNGSPDQTGAGVPICTQCVQIEMKNGNIKGEDIACTHYTDSKKEVLEIKSVNGGSIVVAENDVKGSLKMADARSIDKTSYEKSSEVLSPSLSNNTVSCDSVNNYDNDKGVGGGGDVSRCGAVCFIPNDNVCSEAEKICTEGSINGNIQEQTTHKAKKQKPPRPFALASFLKGLSESTQDDDTEDSFHSAFSYSTYEREKCSKKIELMANAENRDKEVNDSKLISAKDIEDSESYQSFVSSENEIHSVDDGVISESSGKHEFHKDGKLCEAVKQNFEYDKVKEKSSSLVNEKGASKPVDQEYVVTGKETLVGKEKCPSSSSDRSLHDSKSNVERPSLFPVSRSTWRSFSELQKEFNDCSLASRKVNMNDICRCICEQLSNLKVQSVRQNRFDVSKITEIREDIRKNIVKAMSERIENPDIVKDFLKTASLSKSSEIQNVRTSTREQPSNNKGDKRKKGSSIQSDEKNVKKRGSDSSNWRSKNPDDDINSVSTGVSSSSHGKKDFDELLKEQLLIKEIKAKCVTEQENKNIDLFSNRAHGNSHVEETNPRIEGATIKPKVSNSHSIGDSDRYGGARPKTYKQPSAATLRDISSLDVISQSSPDVECQMLDQMHMEMLRKRKERKQQKAESAQESSSNGGNQCIQNIPSLDDSRVKSVSINSRNYATSEDTCQPLEENKIEVSELAQKSTNIEGNDSIECSSSVENHTGSESVCRNDTICVDKSPLIDCTVDSLLDYSKEYDEKAEFLDKNESLPSQNDRSVCSVQSRRSVVDETELSFTDRMALEKSQSPLSKTHFAVMKFNLSALDLSSESDDLQASLSSCTLVSDICSDFDIGSDSKQTFVARKLAFSEGSNDMTNESSSGHRTNPLNSNKACVVTKQEFLKQAMYTTGQSSPKPCRIRPALEVKCVPREEALTNQPSADRSPPRPMVPPDFESKPSPRVRYISPGRTGGKKQSGKISSSVKSFDRFIRRITKKSKVHTSKVENKNAHLNLSNNKSRDCNRSSISTSSFPCYAGQKHMNIGQSAKYETMVPKYFHQHNQFDKNKSDKEYDDRFAEPSPSNWWPYWFSLYDRYIKGLSWPSSCSTCRYYPCYHGQQQSHPFYVGCPWSCYLCHHHRHLMAYSHHPPYLQSYPSAMTTDFTNQCGQLNINSYYDRRAASFQQKYIRHMARVLQEMTSDNS